MRAGPSNSFHTLARVPGIRARFGAMAALACALALAACGGESDERPIPQGDGDAILAQLEEVEAQVDAGECDAAEATAGAVADAIASLPEDVDGELRQTLITASGRLLEQTRDPDQCVVPPEPEPEPPPTGTTDGGGVLEEDDG